MAAPLAVLLLTPGTGLAQTIPSSFSFLERKQEVGLYGGRMTAGTGQFGFGPSGGTLLGARYGVEISGPLSFEGRVGIIDGSRDVIDPSRPEDSRNIGEADVLLTTIDASFRFSFAGQRSWKGVSPVFSAGAGMILDSSPTNELDASLLAGDIFEFGTRFFTTLALGSRWFVTDRIALRGDGQFSLWKLNTPPGFSDPLRGLANVPEGEWLWGTSFTIALLYRW